MDEPICCGGQPMSVTEYDKHADLYLWQCTVCGAHAETRDDDEVWK